jgi:hypothetical protein
MLNPSLIKEPLLLLTSQKIISFFIDQTSIMDSFKNYSTPCRVSSLKITNFILKTFLKIKQIHFAD